MAARVKTLIRISGVCFVTMYTLNNLLGSNLENFFKFLLLSLITYGVTEFVVEITEILENIMKELQNVNKKFIHNQTSNQPMNSSKVDNKKK